MDTLVDTHAAPADVSVALRRLYLLRFAFAAVWAGLLFTAADGLGPLSVALLVLYPSSTRPAQSPTYGRPVPTRAR